ncbi:hypothetical protein [Nevskia sp.]|uniref:hypothetical protein n=1 Tax=Nevskia sp. TaxID=1929292 RepID=UPI0025FBE45B|nr:hypothetical protein [Nevskia sp.]
MSDAEVYLLSYLLPGVATWLADFRWSPGKLQRLQESVRDDMPAESLPSPAFQFMSTVIIDCIMSIAFWPLLIYGLLVQAFDDGR